jgi:histidinol-phosphate aminotransferase
MMRALVNDNVLDLPPYRPGALAPEFTDGPWVRLSANENPLPLPDTFLQRMQTCLPRITRYADSSSFHLRKALAEKHGLTPEHIIVGAGSTELIAMIVTAFLKGNEKVLTSESTFLMYRLAAIEKAGLGALLETPLREDFSIDLDAMSRRLAERVKLIFVASPNNPTGLRLKGEKLSEFAAGLNKNTLLVIDSAYQEYVDEVEEDESLALMKRSENVIVLRTFSKIYGLASLRIGYAMASPRLIDYLNRVKLPFNVSGLSQHAARAMLDETAFVAESVAHNRRERTRLQGELKALGIPVLPSQTNFLLFMTQGDAGKFCQLFAKKGVLLRPGSPFGLPGAVRVSIGLKEENDRFLQELTRTRAHTDGHGRGAHTDEHGRTRTNTDGHGRGAALGLRASSKDCRG